MTTTRRKYAFKTRELAEQEVTRKSIEATRNYMVAIHYRDGKQTQRFRVGKFTADVISHHATTGRPLSCGPIAVLVDETASHPSPEIVDAYDWSRREMSKHIDSRDKDVYDYRQLATEVYQAVFRHVVA